VKRLVRPSLRDLGDGLAGPSVETLGYSRFVPLGLGSGWLSSAAGC